jgi:FKBP-type peptidyl-prolyl cis-trans isomerase FklB
MVYLKWILAGAMVLLPSFAAVAQDAPQLKTDKDKLSYALGMSFGGNFRKQMLELDPSVFAKAFQESYNGDKLDLTETEMQAILKTASQDYRKKQDALQKERGDAAEAQGNLFLATNKSKEGVVTLPSGLQYKILKAGTGEKPKLNDTVKCSYKGTLIDGTVFDASEKHGGPATFPVKGMIAGWTEALQLMPVGSKWQLYVPSSLAYGMNGPGDIGPNATLLFDVELLSIEKPVAAAAPKERPSGH